MIEKQFFTMIFSYCKEADTDNYLLSWVLPNQLQCKFKPVAENRLFNEKIGT